GGALAAALPAVVGVRLWVDTDIIADVILPRADAAARGAHVVGRTGDPAAAAVPPVGVEVHTSPAAHVLARRTDAPAVRADVARGADLPATAAVGRVGADVDAAPVAHFPSLRAHTPGGRADVAGGTDSPALAAVGGVALEVQAAQAFAATRLQAGRAPAVCGEGVTGRDRADGQRHGPPLNLDALHLVRSHIDPRDEALQPGRLSLPHEDEPSVRGDRERLGLGPVQLQHPDRPRGSALQDIEPGDERLRAVRYVRERPAWRDGHLVGNEIDGKEPRIRLDGSRRPRFGESDDRATRRDQAERADGSIAANRQIVGDRRAAEALGFGVASSPPAVTRSVGGADE